MAKPLCDYSLLSLSNDQRLIHSMPLPRAYLLIMWCSWPTTNNMTLLLPLNCIHQLNLVNIMHEELLIFKINRESCPWFCSWNEPSSSDFFSFFKKILNYSAAKNQLSKWKSSSSSQVKLPIKLKLHCPFICTSVNPCKLH